MDPEINKEFMDFGNTIFIVAILSILSIIPEIGQILAIVSLILLIKALGSIKNINYKLRNPHLEEFRTKMMYGIIIGIVGFILVFVFMVIFIVMMSSVYYDYYAFYAMLAGLVILVIIAFIVILVAYYYQMKGWESFNTFLTQNSQMFPEMVARDAIDGSNNLKTAALCMMLSFLIITILIAFILQIIGYFKLAKLKDIESYQYQQQQAPQQQYQYQQPQQQYGQQYQYQQPQQPSPQPEQHEEEYPEPSGARFCPNCGAEIAPEARFCGSCGTDLTQS